MLNVMIHSLFTLHAERNYNPLVEKNVEGLCNASLAYIFNSKFQIHILNIERLIFTGRNDCDDLQ